MVSRFMLGTGAAVITTGLVVSGATAAVPAGPGVAWGAGSNGRLGSGDTKDTLTPKAVTGPSFTDITAGSFHSCGISGGQVFCWGSGGNGRLGTGTTAESLVPVQVPIPGATLVAVTAGSRHTCALSSDGRAFCWGEGGSGRLGTGNTADSLVPVPVVTSAALAGKTLVAISAGWDFTCALDSGNQAYCWGFGAG